VETRITKSIWDFRGEYDESLKAGTHPSGCETSSRHVPHVSFHGRPHPGVIGTAPSPELLAQWTEREADVARRGAKGVCQPVVNGAYVGQDLEPGLRDRIYREGARTSPGREHGGNIDIGALTNGAKIYLVRRRAEPQIEVVAHAFRSQFTCPANPPPPLRWPG
jgi:formamidase